jgi:uncharacterized phage protein gp47/JayE
LSYAAEPYAQFVDDLLLALTGGVIRQQFRFLPEFEPYRLTDPDPIVPSTVQVFGIADGTYRRFLVNTDYRIGSDSTIQWNKREDGTRKADAIWPDDGTTFYANFESLSEAGAAPPLTDRNPGSVTRLLAESFAREFAVLSRQLEEVYRAGFIPTAGGRDLDQLAMLVGVTRRSVTFAAGTVVFARSTPSPADIFIPAGTKLSTAQPPPVVFETLEAATLRRGNLSVEVPVQAMVSGSSGVVPANAIGIVNRPILGIETVANSTSTSFGGSAEDDEAVRRRARRALEGAGLATTGALTAALTTIPGLREKDIQIAEDPLAHPGIVKLNVALPKMDEPQRLAVVAQAIELIERTRPVGVRILPNIAAAPVLVGPASPRKPLLPAVPPAVGTVTPGNLFMKVDVNVQLAPTTLSLTPQQRNDLQARGEKVVADFLADAGIGEVLIYNRLIARLMEIEGVLDATLEMYPQDQPDQPRDQNVMADNSAVRPSQGNIVVELGGALVVLDVDITVQAKGAGAGADVDTFRAAVATEVQEQLRPAFQTRLVPTLSPTNVMGLLTGSDNYTVKTLHYRVEYQEAGVRIHQQDVQFPLSGLEQLWVRTVNVK